jgi:hypothetical protein
VIVVVSGAVVVECGFGVVSSAGEHVWVAAERLAGFIAVGIVNLRPAEDIVGMPFDDFLIFI